MIRYFCLRLRKTFEYLFLVSTEFFQTLCFSYIYATFKKHLNDIHLTNLKVVNHVYVFEVYGFEKAFPPRIINQHCFISATCFNKTHYTKNEFCF